MNEIVENGNVVDLMRRSLNFTPPINHDVWYNLWDHFNEMVIQTQLILFGQSNGSLNFSNFILFQVDAGIPLPPWANKIYPEPLRQMIALYFAYTYSSTEATIFSIGLFFCFSLLEIFSQSIFLSLMSVKS